MCWIFFNKCLNRETIFFVFKHYHYCHHSLSNQLEKLLAISKIVIYQCYPNVAIPFLQLINFLKNHFYSEFQKLWFKKLWFKTSFNNNLLSIRLTVNCSVFDLLLFKKQVILSKLHIGHTSLKHGPSGNEIRFIAYYILSVCPFYPFL